MEFPKDFIDEMRQMMSAEELVQLLEGLQQEPVVSIRLNPSRQLAISDWRLAFGVPTANSQQPTAEPIPWCTTGYYLTERPSFTFDPLLHAGAYYVQEASSMFLERVMRQYVTDTVCMLDLCAAPGGKSTLARSLLTADSLLVSNEPIRNRAQILSENVQKWGYKNHLVTNNYPKDFRKAKALFDVILTDVPCSGEGMFRKDPKAIGEWSLQNVEKCWRLQRDIVSDIWNCLRPGGILIYSTCTFNTKEDEENVCWIADELGADILSVDTEDSWGITGSLLKGFSQPVYRFLPGKTRGEGLFMAVLRKHGQSEHVHQERLQKSIKALNILPPDFLETLHQAQDAPHIPLTYEQAIAYLRREAITLPEDTPRGIVVVCYEGLKLGLAKNVGNRANNLYPKEWRIRSSYVPKT